MKSITQRSRSVWVRIGMALTLLLLGVAWLGQPARAAEFRGGESVVVDAEETIDDDLFLSGETVVIDGVVTGDLFATGSDVTINGRVEGSLFISGRTLALNGSVEGSLYGAGYALTVGPEAAIGRNVYFGGFSLTTAAGSQVGRSLYAAGYQLLLNGDVAGDVFTGSSALLLNGRVGGDVRGEVSTQAESAPPMVMPQFEGAIDPVPPGLRLGDNADVAGEIAVDVTRLEPETPEPIYSPQNERFRWLIGELIALLVIGALLLWIRPSWLRRASDAARDRWLPSLGIGLLALLSPVVLVPLALGVVGLSALLGGWISFGRLVPPTLGVGLTGVAFAVALFLVTAGHISKIVVAYLVGRLLVLRTPSDGLAFMDFVALGLGLVIYMALRALPFGVGIVMGVFVTLLGLGAIVLTLRDGSPAHSTSSPPTM